MENLTEIVIKIGEEFAERISAASRYYMEVDVGEQAEKYGYPELKTKYQKTFAVIPLKHPEKGMKVRVDGRTFVNYAQFESGIAIPGYIAKEVNLPRKTYTPNDSMVLNFG